MRVGSPRSSRNYIFAGDIGQRLPRLIVSMAYREERTRRLIDVYLLLLPIIVTASTFASPRRSQGLSISSSSVSNLSISSLFKSSNSAYQRQLVVDPYFQ
jgi:hypothetical protein